MGSSGIQRAQEVVFVRTGLGSLDALLEEDHVTEIFSRDPYLIGSLCHRTVVESAPVAVVVVGERGGLNPYLLLRISRALGRSVSVRDLVLVKRAFKAEDVPPTISSLEGDVVVIDPYHHGKLCGLIAAAVKEREGRTMLFSPRDRRKACGAYSWHVPSTIIELRSMSHGFEALVLKSPRFPEMAVSLPPALAFEEKGLMLWDQTKEKLFKPPAEAIAGEP